MDRVIKDIHEVIPKRGQETDMTYIETVFEDGSVEIRTDKPYENTDVAEKDWFSPNERMTL